MIVYRNISIKTYVIKGMRKINLFMIRNVKFFYNIFHNYFKNSIYTGQGKCYNPAIRFSKQT
jgi:hypothetical protein